MKRALTVVIGVGLLCWTAAGVAQDARTDLQQLQGTWSGTLLRIDGKEPTEEEKKFKIQLSVTGDRYKAFAEDMLLMEGTLRLDPSPRPRTIDSIFGSGDLKGQVQKGIYDLQGDVFVVNFAKPGDERPRDFQTRPGSEEATVRYVREKK